MQLDLDLAGDAKEIGRATLADTVSIRDLMPGWRDPAEIGQAEIVIDLSRALLTAIDAHQGAWVRRWLQQEIATLIASEPRPTSARALATAICALRDAGTTGTA